MPFERAEIAKALLSDSFEVDACQDSGTTEALPSDQFKVRHLRFTLQQPCWPRVRFTKGVCVFYMGRIMLKKRTIQETNHGETTEGVFFLFVNPAR